MGPFMQEELEVSDPIADEHHAGAGDRKLGRARELRHRRPSEAKHQSGMAPRDVVTGEPVIRLERPHEIEQRDAQAVADMRAELAEGPGMIVVLEGDNPIRAAGDEAFH